MKVIHKGLIAALLAACASTLTLAQEQTVKVAGDPYPPWSIGEAGTRPEGGIAFEITRELFRRMNLDTAEFIYPFKRGIQRIKDGDDDVILMVSRNQERDAFMLFTLPVRDVKFAIFYPANSPDFDWKSWDDLKRYRIGAVSGYNMGDDWPKAIEAHDLQVEEVKTNIFNMKKMLAGRIDLFVTDLEVMQRIIEDNPEYRDQFKWHPKPIYQSVNNLGISKKSFLAPRLAEINRVMREMQQDGTFQTIFCKHGKTYSGDCG